MRLNSPGNQAILSAALSTIAQQNATSPLVNFQVSQPLTLPKAAHKCVVPLISRIFGNSYYKPEVVQYNPPTECGPVGSWAGVSLNWTATSQGRQYDRLAGVTLGNVEIWRTSTSEPTQDGIVWTALKDVTRYIPLFAQSGTLIVDLNNVLDLDSGLNGEYDGQLSATFYQSDAIYKKAEVADLILPLSTLQSDQSNMFSVPPAGNTTITLPPNAISAIAEIQATGNGQEEFWYFNVPNKYLQYLPDDTTYGKGSFREVRLLVDGHIAGIVFPYPVIFTGAMVPAIWRPIVAYGAYDAPTYNIDLTPFIPLLVDGHEHTVTLDVVSDEADGSINSNWFLSGNIQIALDTSGRPTTGNITRYEVPAYATTRHTVEKFDNNSLTFTVNTAHALAIEADIMYGNGYKKHVVWKQELSFDNVQTYQDNATQMEVIQTTNGQSYSMHDYNPVLRDSISFPLAVQLNSVQDETGSGYYTAFEQHYSRLHLPSLWGHFTTIYSVQRANGTYITDPNPGYRRTANGTSVTNFSYLDDELNSYARYVEATNNTIKKDDEKGTLTWDFWPLASGWPESRFSTMEARPDTELARWPGHSNP